MLYAQWEANPDLNSLSATLLVEGRATSILKELANIAALLTRHVMNAMTAPPVIHNLISERTGKSLPDAACLVTWHAIDFPDLANVQPYQIRDKFRQFFRLFYMIVHTEFYGISHEAREMAITSMRNLIHAVRIQESYVHEVHVHYFYNRNFFHWDCTKQLWPFLDSIEILHAIDPRLTGTDQDLFDEYASGTKGLDRLLQKVPVEYCGQCDRWHIYMLVDPTDEFGPSMTLNFHSNPPRLYVDDGNNKCQACKNNGGHSKTSILCCTQKFAPAKCKKCGVLLCSLCEDIHVCQKKQRTKL